MQLRDLTGAYGARFESLLSAVIGPVTTRADLKWIGVTRTRSLPSWLLPFGATKFESESRAEFLAEITVAVRPMCPGWQTPRKVTR
jgi:hypothetical protein